MIGEEKGDRGASSCLEGALQLAPYVTRGIGPGYQVHLSRRNRQGEDGLLPGCTPGWRTQFLPFGRGIFWYRAILATMDLVIADAISYEQLRMPTFTVQSYAP